MRLLFDSPAEFWQEGFPVGNGRLGAMIYGGPEKETLQINEDTLWTGYPAQDSASLNKEHITAAGRLAKARKYREATRLLEEKMTDTEDGQLYQPFGNISVEFIGERRITDYQRQLELADAVVKSSYKNNNHKYEHTCFASAPAQGIIYRICAEEAFSVKISGEGGFLNGSKYDEGGFTFYGQCPGRRGLNKSGIDKGNIKPEFSPNPEEQGMLYEGWGRIRLAEGRWEAGTDGLFVYDTKELTLFLAVRSSFNGYNKHPRLEGVIPTHRLKEDIKAFEKKYDELLAEHIRDYQSFFERVSLELQESGREDMDLKKRLKLYEQDQSDQSLNTLLFDYGRYLLISSSRPGTQAANLQGIWNQDKMPPWFCDYTVNINTQMNYWLTGPCNLPELLEPLVTMNEELLENGRKSARQFFDCEGSACFHNVDLWRKASPADGRAMWAYWPFGAAWMCRNLFDGYLFTQDQDYLKRILPVLRENVIFCEQMLEETPAGYAVCPATSPENQFTWEGENVSVGYYSENELATIRNIFDDYIQACEVMGWEDEVLKEAKRLLPLIVPIAIGSAGQILEWNEELEEPELQHRHLSHLYELHPGCGITAETPALQEAARVSLQRRGDSGTGWSLAWKILMWARLEDGAQVSRILNNMFHLVDADAAVSTWGGGVYPNLLCGHPPFQIDGNFGFTAGIAELLLQSHAGELVLLPAIPPEWQAGKATGLQARGGITVSVEWTKESVKYSLCSQTDRTVSLRVKKTGSAEISLKAGEVYNGVQELK